MVGEAMDLAKGVIVLKRHAPNPMVSKISASFEPALALDGGVDGLAVIERLLAKLPGWLAEGGLALLEIGADQGEAIVARCASVLPGWRCTVEPDLAGLPRVALIGRDQVGEGSPGIAAPGVAHAGAGPD